MGIIGAIRLLDTHTINKIAAGEVVERPSSVVKELVENSIDAKASSITVEIKNGGIDLIRVTDNGVGIPKDQVEVAFLRHATSKITSAEDLYEVLSLGFRGEALASISAVSNVELVTKQEKELTGKRIEVSGGKMTASEEIACPNGTTFIMRHLFFNVPARREFLSSSGAEGAKISDYMYKLALAHPEIAFKYIQNGKTIFSTSGDHDLTHCVLNIYGKDYAKNTLKCHYESSGIICTGLLGNPTLTRGNRNYEHFFINGRYIKSTLLQKAVEDAYKTLVMVGKFPFVIVHLQLRPEEVDVNVHPTKLQVRFKDMDLIYNTVYKAVSATLQEAYLVPQVSPTKPSPIGAPKPEVEQVSVDTFFAPRKMQNEVTAESLLGLSTPSQYMIDEETGEVLGLKEPVKDKPHKEVKSTADYDKETSLSKPSQSTIALSGQSYEKEIKVAPVHRLFGKKEDAYETPIERPCALKEEAAHSRPSFMEPPIVASKQQVEPAILPSDYRVVGQIFETYWLIEYHGKVFIIDQHSAHERVMYEKFMAEFKANKVATQLLLMPETLNVTPLEMQILDNQGELFQKLGFAFERFGETAVVIREVPFIMNEPLSPKVFREVLDEVEHTGLKDITDLKAEAIIRMSCRSAIKAHDRMSEAECQKLIESLLALDNPFTCPHGRPTLVALTQSDIEKMFKRI